MFVECSFTSIYYVGVGVLLCVNYIIYLLLVSHRYELPSRSYFGTNLIPKLYTEVAERLRADMKDVDFLSK